MEAGKKNKVYCQTAAERCRDDDIYLGEHHSGEKVRCPVCGRFTVAGDVVGLHHPSTSMPWRTGYDFLD